MDRKNYRRVSVVLNSQTLYHLERLAAVSGYGKNIGRVIDKLVREKQLALRPSSHSNFCVCCGEEIPEGRLICPTCEKGAERQ